MLADTPRATHILWVGEALDRLAPLDALQSDDRRSTWVRSVEQAGTALAANDVDLVVLDLADSPLASKTLQSLQLQAGPFPVPVLALVNEAAAREVEAELEKTADAYLVRPVDPRVLGMQIDGLLWARHPELHARGEAFGGADVNRFVVELERRERQLEAQRRRQVDFLGLLAHELRNPLAAADAAIHAIASERDASPPKLADGDLDPLDVVRRQVDNLTRLVADVLDVSRVSAHNVLLDRHPTDLRTCARAAASAVRHASDAAGHELSVVLGNEPLRSNVDATRIEQLLVNLLDNAIKYTPRGGKIELHVQIDPANPVGSICIKVRDTGVGLPQEGLEDAFEMYVQYARTLDRSQGGLGLGLTRVRRLAELHGGSVQAFSEGLGCGTTMQVCLPRTYAPSEPKPERPRRRLDEVHETHAVLLVEDNEDLRRLLARGLRRAGHRVIEAASGPEGEARAYEELPDAIVLDLGLPGLDGFELATELRGAPQLRHVRLIALTGYGSRETQERALEAGFDAHLVKPVDLAALLDEIECAH